MLIVGFQKKGWVCSLYLFGNQRFVKFTIIEPHPIQQGLRPYSVKI